MLYIRKARAADKNDIKKLSTQIWEDDYIFRVFDEWLIDGGFYVAVLNKQVIGTVKMTILQDVLWLEGLRLMPSYQGKGYGELLSEYVFSKAGKLKAKGAIKDIEFSTYYHNKASLHMGKKAGFKIIEKYTILHIKNKNTSKLKLKKAYLSANDFAWNRKHISAGWKFVQNSHNAIEWLNRNCSIYQAKGFKIYAKHNDSAVNITRYKIDDVKYLKKCIMSLSNEEYAEIIIPSRHRQLRDMLLKEGFSYWDKPYKPNLFLLQLIG